MARSWFIRLSGWGLVLAALCLLATFLPNRPQGFHGLLFPTANLLITLGLAGLYARYGEQVGSTAKLALGAGIISGAAALVLSVWNETDQRIERPTLNIVMALMFAGLFVFGLAALRGKPMRRGNGLPALTGFWWPALVIQGYVFPQVTQLLGPSVPVWFTLTIFSAMSISLALLGYVLQADASTQPAAG